MANEVPQPLNLTDFQKIFLPWNTEIPGLLFGKRGSSHLYLLCPKDNIAASYYVQLLLNALCINVQGEKTRLKDTWSEMQVMGL